jgi:hypothetical protein
MPLKDHLLPVTRRRFDPLAQVLLDLLRQFLFVLGQIFDT